MQGVFRDSLDEEPWYYFEERISIINHRTVPMITISYSSNSLSALAGPSSSLEGAITLAAGSSRTAFFFPGDAAVFQVDDAVAHGGDRFVVRYQQNGLPLLS